MGIRTLMALDRNVVGWGEKEHLPLQPGEVRIRCRYGAEKHGTMQAILKGYGSARGQFNDALGLYFGEGLAWKYPMVLGNMNFGEVVEAGPLLAGQEPPFGAESIKEGDLVAVSGPFQPFTVARVDECFAAPAGLSWKTAMMQDPCEFALGALRDGGVRFGDHVAVFSLGAIGLATVQMAKAAGAETVIGIDPLPARRQAALACGATCVLGDDPEDIGWQIRRASRREGIDVVIDFSGAVPAMQAAFRALAPLGTLVLGAYPDQTTALIDFGRESHANQLNIVFTRACSHPLRDHPRWDWRRIRAASWQAILQGRVDGSAVVDDPVPFDTLLEAYPRIAHSPNETIKMSVEYPR